MIVPGCYLVGVRDTWEIGKAHFLVLLKRHYQKTLDMIRELRETRFESEQHQWAGLDESKGRRKAEGGSSTAFSQQA